MGSCFADWTFQGEWRRYQRLCLEAFDADREADRHQTMLVAPPGSGKTIVGLELARRLGVPALVLCPTQTIQQQWRDKQGMFGPRSPHLHALTYQALCRADDPGGMLRAAAERHWARERAEATDQTVAEVVAETEAWHGQAAARRERDISRLLARYTKRAADGELPDIDPRDLLSAPARARLRELLDAGVATVVLDECHHLISLWGALLAALLEEIRPAHVIGLTATSPTDLTEQQAALYRRLLDRPDFHIPTPAVVREGHLAPFQELLQLCEPLTSEREWLGERHDRFQRALVELDVPPAGAEHLSLSAWLVARLRERLSASGGQMSWAEFARRSPKLADAGLRWMHERDLDPPVAAPRGERTRAPLQIDDWVVLLGDYALRCLRADRSTEALARSEQLQVALRDLGYSITRQGVRRTGGEVDRVLLNSASKPLAMCEALACEYDHRGQQLRAVVLTDSEHPPKQPPDSPLTLSGGARGLLAAVGEDLRLMTLRPALVSSTTFAVLPDDSEWWIERLDELAVSLGFEELRGGFGVRRDGAIAIVGHASSAFTSKLWTAMATTLLAGGDIHLLVGTRGLLGEGWDCPPLNVLIDMTAVAADISVRQMRGRTLRLDPDQPDKLASNWDVVCVAPDLSRGSADYHRFVRRHLHLHAPCEDGTIETGPSHVHPELSPFGPPDADRFPAINAEQRQRAADLTAALERWRVGEPYRGVDLDALALRRPPRATGRGDLARAAAPTRWPRWALGLTVAAAAAGVAATGAVLAAPAALAGFGWAAYDGAVSRPRRHPRALPLEWAAGAVCDAYLALGELPEGATESLTFTVRPEGWVRVSLPEATPQASALVCAALDELLGGGALPRYVVSRGACAGALSPARKVWHPVPADLGRHKDRASAFEEAWSHWCGRGELVFCHGSERGLELATQAIQASACESQRRRIWN